MTIPLEDRTYPSNDGDGGNLGRAGDVLSAHRPNASRDDPEFCRRKLATSVDVTREGVLPKRAVT